MAVLVEGISVVVRVDAIVSKYPGAWDAFAAAVPNRTLCADAELARVGFTAPDDTKHFVDGLSSKGLVYLRDGQAEDLVVVDQQRGLAAPCTWAEFGRIPWEGDPKKEVGACRVVGSKVRELVTPPGWSFEGSLSSQFLFVPNGWVPEFMDFVRNDGGTEVYRDLRTGKLVYVGRIRPKT